MAKKEKIIEKKVKKDLTITRKPRIICTVE